MASELVDQNIAASSSAAPDSSSVAGLEYARRVYDRVIDWYKVAEAKGQLLLTANGAFAAILIGTVSGNLDGVRYVTRSFGIETWLVATAAFIAYCGATGFAAASLLSRHQHNIDSDFRRLAINPSDPDTYRGEAVWYFGHIASLRFDAAVELLRKAGDRLELETLTYNVVGLSHVVLRKHRLQHRLGIGRDLRRRDRRHRLKHLSPRSDLIITFVAA